MRIKNDKHFPAYDITTLVQIMWNTRLNWIKTKAHKYRYKYLKELCKSIIKDLQDEEDYENAKVFKDLLKDIKRHKYTDDGRFFRDIKYNYHYLDELYKLNIFQFGKENEND